jgi:hypothetical protein
MVIQSLGRLWYFLLVDLIDDIGFVVSGRDRCFYSSKDGDYLLDFLC